MHPTSNIQDSAAGGNSYGQILRSSSIIGGATGINYVIGMVRTKAIAVLCGPSGVGLVGLHVSITGLVSTIAQLGIDQSGEAATSFRPVLLGNLLLGNPLASIAASY